MTEFEMLRRRFERGEIEVEEYERRLDALIRRYPRAGLEGRLTPPVSGRGDGASRPPAVSARPRGGRRKPALGGCLMAVAGALALVAAGVGAWGALIANEDAATATTEVRALPVSAAPTVRVRNPWGDVTVVAGGADRVTVQATGTTRRLSQRQAGNDLQEMGVELVQTADGVTVETRQDRGGGFPTRTRLDLLVTAPPTSNLDAELGLGDLEARGLTGTMRVDVDRGSVRLDGVALSGASTVEVENGDVDLRGQLAADEQLEVQVDVGDVRLALPTRTDARLEAGTREGEVSVLGWPIPVSDDYDGEFTGSARGDLSPNPTGGVTIEVNVGDITVASRG
jgi:hypothetical protein